MPIDSKRARLKRFGWIALLGLVISLSLYLMPLAVIARVTEADLKRISHRSGPAYDSRPFLDEIGDVSGSGVHYMSNGFFLYPFFLDDIYRPILNLAGRNDTGEPNWIAIYLLGVEK